MFPIYIAIYIFIQYKSACLSKYRIIIFICLVIMAYLLSIGITVGLSDKDFERKLSLWRRCLRRMLYVLIRTGLFVIGFFYIPIKKENGLKKFDVNNIPSIVIANHNTAFDGLLLPWLTRGTFAAKIELSKAPFIGRIAKSMQAMWIDRSAKDSRNSAIQAIIKHANNPDMPPLCIFPQGTTSRVGTLTTFKIGAFLPKKEIQIIGLDWVYNDFDLSFCDYNMLTNFYLTSCNLINFVGVKVFKPYIPNNDEIKNPTIFAENARLLLLNNLPGMTATNHSLNDFILLTQAHKSNPNFDTSTIIFENIATELHLRTKTVTKLCKIFNKLDDTNSGYINFNTFCKCFNSTTDNIRMKNLFYLFTTKNKELERIGFDEFLVGVSVCYVDKLIYDACKIMFDGCLNDYNNKMLKYNDILGMHQYIIDKNESKYDLYNKEMINFCNILYETDDEKNNGLNYNQFCDRIINKDLNKCVDHFLQFVVMKKLGIILNEKDFYDDQVTVHTITGINRSGVPSFFRKNSIY